MIVEDEKIVSLDLRTTLEGKGYEVIDTASSFEEAVEKAREDVPDIVLMDIVLKGHGNGIDAAKRIIQRYNIPIIYITAYSDFESRLREEGSDNKSRFLTKPISNEDLLASIREIESSKDHGLDRKI